MGHGLIRRRSVIHSHGCPCGQAGVEGAKCACPKEVVARYSSRISGPLRDRIDLWVMLPRVPPATLVANDEPEASATVASRIAAARSRQLERGPELNSRLAGRRLMAAAGLSNAARARLAALAEKESLSARGTERLLRVGRTIADLAAEPIVNEPHLDEAARFRSPARRLAELAS